MYGIQLDLACIGPLGWLLPRCGNTMVSHSSTLFCLEHTRDYGPPLPPTFLALPTEAYPIHVVREGLIIIEHMAVH